MKGTERRLLRLVPRGRTAAFAGLALVQGGLVLAQAELLARAVADLSAGPLPWLAGVAAARALAGWTVATLAAGTAAGVKAGLRSELLARPAGAAGERVTLVTRGLDALDAFFTGYLPQLFASVVVPVLVLVRLAVLDWRSALVITVTLPLVPLFGALVGLRTSALTGRQWAVLERLGGHFRDVMAGLATLRAHARTGHQAEVIAELATAHRRATNAALRVAFLSSLVLELVCALSVALVAVPVGLRLVNGSMPLSAGLLVLLLTPEAFLPLRALGSRFHASTEGIAAADRAFAVLDAPAPGRSAGTVLRASRGPHLLVEDVTFRYPNAPEPALRGFNLEVSAGERVALAGPSGAGKTTLLRLLLGFLTPDEGRILVDGVDLRDLDLEGWRAGLSWVPQRPHLFAASVADNLRLGRPGATDDQVRAAAATAHADAFVTALPDGYATVVGDGGEGLSAGQRQRLALARAHLRDAPLLLWDEPTARLDLATEKALLTTAPALLSGRTALIVAHRPALLACADRVVQLAPAVQGASL